MVDVWLRQADICTKCGHTRELHRRRSETCTWSNPPRSLVCACYRPTFRRAREDENA